MRLRASSLVLAGALIASGGALAVAQTPGPGSTTETTATATAEATATTEATATAEATAEDSPTTEAGETETRTPPGWAKRDQAHKAKSDRGPVGQGRGPMDAADSDDRGPGRAQGRGPDATGPAAYGLCRAWADQEDPAAKAEHVPPFRNLAAAAGGVDKVDEYCAALPERENDESDDED